MQPTLKVNIRAQQEREKREKERLAREAISKIQATAGPIERPRRRLGLNFHEPGTFVAQGEQFRKRLKLEELQKKVAARAAKTGISDAVKLASLTSTPSTLDVKEEEVPDIEWWDKPLLHNRPLTDFILRPEDVRVEDLVHGITNLIEHPVKKEAPGAENRVAQIPIYLTKKERKKLRKQNRKNINLEKQEKIKLGLLPIPEPKLKRSNIMYALGNEAIVDPSKTEQMVRDQEEKRKQAHLEHNEAKKLTLEEKRSKKLRKIREDLSVTGTWVSVFHILNMSSQAHRFKVTQNAKQLTMSGVLLLYKDMNVVVVEGGPKQQRKYKHLMTDRINWTEDPLTAPEGSDKATRANRCVLVWEGQVIERSFRGFKVKTMNSENEARDFFKQFKVEHYWDLAFKMSILDSIEDP